MNDPSKTAPEAVLSRRDFVARSLKTGLAAAVVSAAALALRDGTGSTGREAARSVTIPDFSLPGLRPKLGIVTGADRTQSVDGALKAIGGIDQFIKPGDRVVLKVNAAFASPASLAATTHPDLVSAVTKLCLGAGARAVVVTDNPINDPASCFALSGIARAAEAAGAKVVLPSANAFQRATLAGGRLIKDWPFLMTPLQGATKLIGMAPVKNHHRSGASLAMKNWYGLLGGRRNLFHQDIHTIILELARLVRPTLVILDGTTSMMSNGPTGGSLEDLKPTNTMIVSTDQVAADAVGATLLGLAPSSLPFLVKAAAAGLGTIDFESLQPARG